MRTRDKIRLFLGDFMAFVGFFLYIGFAFALITFGLYLLLTPLF